MDDIALEIKWKAIVSNMALTSNKQGHDFKTVMKEIYKALRLTKFADDELALWKRMLGFKPNQRVIEISSEQIYALKVLAYMRQNDISIDKRNFIDTMIEFSNNQNALNFGQQEINKNFLPDDFNMRDLHFELQKLLGKEISLETVRAWCRKTGIKYSLKKVYSKEEFLIILRYADRKKLRGENDDSKKVLFDAARKTLGVSSYATKSDIKRAWKQLISIWHPDKHQNSAEAEIKSRWINDAYGLLMSDNLIPMFYQLKSA